MLQKTNAFRNGLLIFLFIGVYFVLLELLGLTDNIFLRFVNFLFVIIGVNNTLKKATKEKLDYLKKFAAALFAPFLGVLLSAVSLFIYLTIFDNDLSAYAMTLIPAETNFSFAAVIFVEGFLSSLMLVFIMMQYWKNVEVKD